MSYLNICTGKCEEYEELVKNNDIINNLEFEPDEFQKHGFVSIHKGENTLVTAHTGSGKTLIAEYALLHYTNLGKKVVYTAPIKTLSNQKYNDLKKKYQHLSIGLMTGDNKINPDAQVVVMTTEILRNALFDIGKDKDKKKDLYFEDNFIDNIGCGIFDEVHYINDKSRGHVWEETINLLKTPLVLLSATIDKPEEFANWIGDTKKKTINLISTSQRVIPLEHYIFINNKIHKILDSKDNFSEENYRLAFNSHKNMIKNNNYSNKHILNSLILYLKEKNLFQTVFFCFSKIKCQEYASSITLNLVDHEETHQIKKIFNSYMHSYEKQYEHIVQYRVIKELLFRGICCHHSGLLSVLKEIIEILFQKGLIKILFATETLSVGVNMPTRTVIYMEIEKFSDGGRRMLNTAEYKQMAGRAGRRGLDKFGYVIIMPSYDFFHQEDLKKMMLGKVPSISSQFNIDYSFILKIMQSNTSNIEDFIDTSLFDKDNKEAIKDIKNNIIDLKEYINNIDINITDEQKNKFNEYYEIHNLQQNTNSFFKLNKKQLKKLDILKKYINNHNLNSQYESYKLYIDSQKKLFDLENNIDIFQNYVADSTNNFLNFLEKYNYIKLKDEHLNNRYKLYNYNVTNKSIIASQINECNPILLTEIIFNNMFDELSAPEIVGLLGIFIGDIKIGDRKTFYNIKCPDILKTKIQFIQDLIKKFSITEKEIGIYDEQNNIWEIFYDYVEVGYKWASGYDIKEIFNIINTFEGNFIRSILKINNMVTDLISLNNIYGNNSIIPRLQQIEDLIIRDIVSVNSLYVNE